MAIIPYIAKTVNLFLHSSLEQKNQYDNNVYEQINKKLDEVILNQKKGSSESKSTRQKTKSRTQEYADKWNANMFLNDFDKRDENAGVNVKLKDVYLEKHLPHYVWGNNKKEDTDLKELLIEYIVENNENKMLLILGQPGIGKSTLITWITANFHKRKDDILVYRFASDLKKIEWERYSMFEEYSISERILKQLGLSNDDLNGKVLILDGYDEISVRSGRNEILDHLYWELVKYNAIKKFTLIITCRVNYIEKFEEVECRYITLQPWSEEQIKSFSTVFQGRVGINIFDDTIVNLLNIKEIFGIPLILYMVLALNILIEKEGSIVDVYDKIFSLEGGIYDRCIDNKSFADKHRISEMKMQIHQISREIAMWMFENNPDEACVPQDEYQKICNKIMQMRQKNEDIEQDFLIGNFFRIKHCEGEEGDELYFAHRSIYEYFVVEYIFSSICEVIDSSEEDLAGILGKFLIGNILSQNMLEYLKIKFLKSKLREKFYVVNEAFQLMLKNGMVYYTGVCYKNVIRCEMNIFANMLEVLHLFDKKIYLPTNKYIRCNTELKLNLKNVIFLKKYLTGAYLKRADLQGANLENSILRRTDLRKTDLSGANLKKADLSGSDIRGANLKDAILDDIIVKGTIMDTDQVKQIELDHDLRNVLVDCGGSKKIIKYEKYSNRKK